MEGLSTLIYIGVGNSPHNDVVLNTAKVSPVLQREGFTQNEFERSGNPVPTVEGESNQSLTTLTVSYILLIIPLILTSLDVREAEVATHEGRSRRG